jgi:hypothetical protein
VPAPLQARLRAALLSPSAQLRTHMVALHIKAFEYRPDADYNRIHRLEAEAVAAGYAALA